MLYPRVSRTTVAIVSIFTRRVAREEDIEFDSSSTLVAPPTAENEIAYSTQCCRFPSLERCAVKQFGVRRTVARALDVLVAKPLSCTTAEPVHDTCATPLTTDVICTRDSADSRAAPRTEPHSALDLTHTRLVSCAHRVIRESSFAKIAKVDTRAT